MISQDCSLGGYVPAILSPPLPPPHPKPAPFAKRVRELEPAPNGPLPSYLSLCFAVRWYERAGWSVSLPLEHNLKMENKMHCDILARRPFSGFGKASWTGPHCHTAERKPHSPNVTSELVCCYIFSIHLIIFLFIFKDKGSRLLQLCLCSHKSLRPFSHKSRPQESKTCTVFSCFKLARVHLQKYLYLNDGDSLQLIHIFQRNWPKLSEIKLHFGHFKSLALSINT